MNNKILPLILAVAMLGLYSQNVFAQSCNKAGTPISFNTLGTTSCILQINWSGSMPALECGFPGTPADGSTIPHNRRLKKLQVTIGGNVIVLYDNKHCGVFNLKYGPEPNTYVTTLASGSYCSAAEFSTIPVKGNQAGGSAFVCDLINNDIAAPVELTYFKGSAERHSNKLNWATSSEENVEVFVVEKSGTGLDFDQEVGYVNAAGFSSTTKTYQLEDRTPKALTYYRLRSIDYDGSLMFSDVVAVERRGELGDNFLEVSPVPLNKGEAFNVTYEAKSKERVRVIISDISGRKIYEEDMQLETGIHTWNIDLPGTIPNLLVLQVHGKNAVITQLLPVVGFD